MRDIKKGIIMNTGLWWRRTWCNGWRRQWLIPKFKDHYRYTIDISPMSMEHNCAREQLWAMEQELAEWPLPADETK